MAREYKDSGIEWIGEIPEEWNVTLLSTVFAEHCLKNIGLRETNLLSLSYGNIIRKNINENGGLLPESFDGYNIIDTNDIVFRLTDLQNDKRSLRTGLCKERGIITSAYTTIRSRGNNIYAPYFHYLFHSYDECKIFYGLGDGVRQSMNFQDLRKLQIVVPSLDEQQRIADFLDEKCREIDKLVALQEQMIEELKAYKQSVITEAVTKGLNPYAPMRDSGIDWIGKVPKGWKVCKLKNVFSLLNGRAYLDPELLETGKYRILRVGNLFSSDKWYYSDMELDNNKYCESGDLLYGWSASIGPYIWKEEKVIYHYHIWKVLFGNNDLYYSFYMLQALTMAKQRDMHGSAMQHLTKVNMDNSIIVMPPIDEQRTIVSYLDTKCAEIDKLISIKQNKISKLKEYKKSIIFEYVTGKKYIK